MQQIQHLEEAQVIGALIRKPEHIAEVSTILKPIHLRDKTLCLVYASILGLQDDGKPISVLGLFEEINRSLRQKRAIKHYPYNEYTVEEIEAGYLVSIEAESTYAPPATLALTLRDRGIRDELQRFSRQIPHIVDAAESGELAYEEVSKECVNIMSTINYGDVIENNQVIAEFLEALDKRQSGLVPVGIPYGLCDLDRLTGGMHQQELIIVAARPSVGKTAFVAQIIKDVAKQGHGVVFFSLEQSRDQIMQRIVANELGLDSHDIRMGKLSDANLERVVDESERMRRMPIYWDDTPNQSINSITAKARKIAYNSDIKLITLDYLQLIDVSRGRARHEEIAAITKRLKQLARELNIPIMVLAQLNREADNDEEPRLRHLKEGGSIEQDADTVIILHRSEAKQEGMSVDLALVDLLLKKQRSGSTGDMELIFRKECVRFESKAMGE